MSIWKRDECGDLLFSWMLRFLILMKSRMIFFYFFDAAAADIQQWNADKWAFLNGCIWLKLEVF